MSEIIYRVRGWSDHFENSKSRERQTCSFFCIPNKQHGLGFTRIMAEADGAAIYGIWVCILATCSQQKSPRDGWLTLDGQQPGSRRAAGGHQTGTPLTPSDLALKFHRPLVEIERCLEVLSLPQVAWIEKVDNKSPARCPPSARRVPAECPPTGPSRMRAEERREENRREENRRGGEANGASRLPLSLDRVIEIWNSTEFPKVSNLSSDRETKLKARLKEEFWSGHFESAIAQASQSGFLKGDNDRGWKMTFDFIIRPGSLEKIVEGKYKDKENAKISPGAKLKAERSRGLCPENIKVPVTVYTDDERPA